MCSLLVPCSLAGEKCTPGCVFSFLDYFQEKTKHACRNTDDLLLVFSSYFLPPFLFSSHIFPSFPASLFSSLSSISCHCLPPFSIYLLHPSCYFTFWCAPLCLCPPPFSSILPRHSLFSSPSLTPVSDQLSLRLPFHSPPCSRFASPHCDVLYPARLSITWRAVCGL